VQYNFDVDASSSDPEDPLNAGLPLISEAAIVRNDAPVHVHVHARYSTYTGAECSHACVDEIRCLLVADGIDISRVMPTALRNESQERRSTHKDKI
jgi:hypothetical protein